MEKREHTCDSMPGNVHIRRDEDMHGMPTWTEVIEVDHDEAPDGGAGYTTRVEVDDLRRCPWCETNFGVTDEYDKEMDEWGRRMERRRELLKATREASKGLSEAIKEVESKL